MGFKTSYSQNSTYIKCPQHWNLKYNGGWEAEIQGASTFFGSAVDAAVTAMLEGSQDFIKIFYDRWEFQSNYGTHTRVFDNANITYTHKDFDADLLEAKDFPFMEKWAKELGLMAATATPTNEELVALMKQTAKDKSNPYKRFTDEQFKFFNRCSWLSMKRKGKLLINAFHTQFFPKIKKVVATQMRSKIEDTGTGDSMVGVVDMVLEIDGYDKPIIFDLKTASQPYDQDQIDVSPQLTLYAAMEAQKYATDLVGYVVLSKNIQKDEVSTCKSCGHNKTTRHATCDNVINGNRCGGAWDTQKVPRPMVQVMVEKKSQDQINDLLTDSANIITCMKNGLVYKNHDACSNWFGSDCPYKKLCHKGDSSGLKNKKLDKAKTP